MSNTVTALEVWLLAVLYCTVLYCTVCAGVAAGLHAARLPLPRGVRRHPQADRPLQEVGTGNTIDLSLS